MLSWTDGCLHQIGLTLADLHDTPVRMLEKGVIHGVVPWAASRTRLYWRLRRRLAEDRVKKEIFQVRKVWQGKEGDHAV